MRRQCQHCHGRTVPCQVQDNRKVVTTPADTAYSPKLYEKHTFPLIMCKAKPCLHCWTPRKATNEFGRTVKWPKTHLCLDHGGHSAQVT